MITCGRITWAFVRDVSFYPFSMQNNAKGNNQSSAPVMRFFTKVDERLEFPARATLLSFLFTCIYGLLYLASMTAFNSIVNTAVLFLNITYVVPQGIVVFYRQRRALPPRYLDLGIFGHFCNIFSILWIVVLGVFICLPVSLPVELESMSYTSVVLVGIWLIALCMWFLVGRTSFVGPKIDWEMLQFSPP